MAEVGRWLKKRKDDYWDATLLLTQRFVMDSQPFAAHALWFGTYWRWLPKEWLGKVFIEECHSSISKDAIAEAIKLSGEAFLKHADEFALEPIPA